MKKDDKRILLFIGAILFLLLYTLLLIACSQQPTTIKESLQVESLFANWVEVPNNQYGAGRQLVHGWFGMDKDSIVYAEFGTWYYHLYQFRHIQKMVVRNNRITGDGWRIEFMGDEIMFNNWRLKRLR
jgi:hypothetical protein